jgi:beta-lactam-binding protein with PASTA domain
MTRRAAAALLIVLGVAVSATALDFPLPRTPGGVYFEHPKDGATVPPTFKVDFGLRGLKVRPAGEDTEDRTSGHHHLIIDGRPIEAGTVIPADATHLHYGQGQTGTDITLPPGTHTLTLQFADGAHRSYGPKWAATITVHVAAPAARKMSLDLAPTIPSGPAWPKEMRA